MKQMFIWIDAQIEWLKSFFTEPVVPKGSMKRFLSFWIVMTFMYSYVKLVDKIEVDKAATLHELPDVPFNWMILLAGIIGLGILDKLADNGTLKNVWSKMKSKKTNVNEEIKGDEDAGG